MKRLVFLMIPIVFLSFGCGSFVIRAWDDGKLIPLSPSWKPTFFEAITDLPNPYTYTEKAEGQEEFVREYFSFDSFKKSDFRDNNYLAGTIYEPKKAKTDDMFIVIPGAAGNIGSGLIADHLACLGYRTVRLNSGFFPLTPAILEKAREQKDGYEAAKIAGTFCRDAFRQRVVDITRLLNWLDTHFKVQPGKYHVIGISLGGIIGSLLYAVDNRVDSLAMILSSGHLEEIVITPMMTEVWFVKEIRDILLNQFHLSYAEAESLLKYHLNQIEPTKYAYRMDRRKILMVSGGLDMLGCADAAMPFSATYKTWEDFGRPEWIILPFTGHLTSYIAFINPVWIEFDRNPLHLLCGLISRRSYFEHILKEHFIPKTLSRSQWRRGSRE